LNDDWRVQVLFREDRAIDQWHDRGHARELERDLSGAFQDRVIVSRVNAILFIYAADQAQAERARAVVESQAQENSWDLESNLTRWNEETLEWEPPPAGPFPKLKLKPMPKTPPGSRGLTPSPRQSLLYKGSRGLANGYRFEVDASGRWILPQPFVAGTATEASGRDSSREGSFGRPWSGSRGRVDRSPPTLPKPSMPAGAFGCCGSRFMWTCTPLAGAARRATFTPLL
jgi:hypothetical protein